MSVSSDPGVATARRLETGDPGFPACLAAIRPPVAALWLRGAVPPAPRVALVGARRCDDYGLELARRLGEGLAREGLSIVSGGAAGVDSAALSGCLTGGGLPVAVLGTGVDVAYPAANRGLFERVAAAGALVSEYPPGTPGRPAHFPQRNRLISALSDAVVVIRAALRSGSLITARLAARQGRRVLAVPGPAGDELSAGVHLLLRQGAGLVEGVSDVLAALGLDSARQTRLDLEPDPAAGDQDEGIELAPEERQVLAALGAEGALVDHLVAGTGLPAGQLAAILLGLELKGLVAPRPGMRYVRV